MNHMHSPLASVLVQHDTNALRQSLCETWKDLEGVQGQIRAVMEGIEKAFISLRNLRETESKLLHTAATTAPLLSPFQHLPQDILAEIAGEILALDIRTCDAPLGIWPLTHVCKAWRSNILSLPHLWSTFSITYRTPPKLELVSKALERSKNNPLSLSIEGSLYEYNSEESISQSLALLTQHSARWKNLKLSGRIRLDSLVDAYEHLPLLETLTLNLEIRYYDSTKDKYSRIFAVAPNLRSLSCTGKHIRFLKFPVQVALQLRNVKCPVVFGSRNAISIPHCKNLISLDIIPGPFDGDQAPNERILLPVLRHLQLDGNTSTLGRLRLPSLRSLNLPYTRADAETISVIQAFLDSSQISGLFSLGISFIQREDVGCFAELFSLPALHSLHALTLKQEGYLGRMGPALYNSDKLWNEPWTWIESLLLDLIYKRPQSGHEESQLLLPHLKSLTLQLKHWQRSIGDNLFDTLEEFIISRTTIVDEASQDKDQPSSMLPLVPSRLEEVYVKYEDKPQVTVTMADFIHLEARVRSLMKMYMSLDISDKIEC